MEIERKLKALDRIYAVYDVLGVLAIEAQRRVYAAGGLHCTGSGLIANRPMQVLMLPPAHRERIEPILSQLRAIRI